jgi:1,3-beta-glucanosyltransferase GAS5
MMNANRAILSLSEYGCTTNGRDFGEIEALMSSKMTGVYSGGLMYEYSMEDNGFGIVELSGGSVEELDEFTNLQSAMSQFPAPTGDGGAAKTTHSVPCPTKDATWEVDPSAIPAMPKEAETFMKNGAGQGKGLKGPGSQTAGDSGLSTTNTTGGKSSDKANPANGRVGAFDVAPLLVTGVTLGFTLFGAMLL